MGNLQKRQMRSDRLKLALSVIWLAITFSMVSWWWIFSLRQLESLHLKNTEAEALQFESADQNASKNISEERKKEIIQSASEDYGRIRSMIFWEGSILLVFILGGGAALLILTNRERKRNLQLRLFFSNFSHDLKTSLTRLRLRTEVLAQTRPGPELQELLAEASRLDLQLENSLWVARGEEQSLHLIDLRLADIIGELRVEWPDMEISLERNAIIKADPIAIRSVFRNLLQNSWLHGEARRIDIRVDRLNSSEVILSFQDNGKGFQGDLLKLGRSTLPSQDREGNGIGLFLTQFLVERMQGRLRFESQTSGFSAHVHMRGTLG